MGENVAVEAMQAIRIVFLIIFICTVDRLDTFYKIHVV